MLVTCIIIAVGWIALTLWVERRGPARLWHFSATKPVKNILIVFDPDPIYNLDEQVCLSMGKALAEENIDVTIATVRKTEEIDVASFDGFVLCANTYNWTPDWSITNFVKATAALKYKPVIAITLGSGSTEHARQVFNKVILQQDALLIDSRTLWLMRPNDESRMKENNVAVARSIAHRTGIQLADSIKLFQSVALPK